MDWKERRDLHDTAGRSLGGFRRRCAREGGPLAGDGILRPELGKVDAVCSCQLSGLEASGKLSRWADLVVVGGGACGAGGES